MQCGTDPQQVLDSIGDILKADERVLPGALRVRFETVADDALLIRVHEYVDTVDWAQYLEIAEELKLRILDIVAKAGTHLSLPSRTLHVEQLSMVRSC